MGTIATTRVYRNNPPLNTGEGLTILRNNQIALRELIGSLPPATITSVSSNTITPTSTMLIVNANATINTITSTVNLSGETTTDNAQAEQEFHDGAVIKIIATSGKTVTIGNSGNVQLLNNASSVTVSSTTPTVLTYNASTHKWVEHERVSELIGGVVGDLSNLTTTAKNTVVAAINEVDSNADTNASNHSTLLSAVGNIAKSGNNISAISSQITRTSIIAAINDIVSKIGLPLSGLTSSVKSSIIAAINSLVSDKAAKTEVGTLTDLTTTAKTSAVAAINELKSTHDTEIGTLSNLTTTNKDNVVSAINELNTGVVHTSGDETVAGNKTFSGTVDLTRTTDAGGTSTNKPALRIGSLSGKHLEFDGDEIMAKNTGNTVGQLNINLDGGLVKIGSGGLTVTGTITGDVTGNVTGNADTATKATNDIDGNAIKTTYAKLASPIFTGTPKAPTASASTNNTQIATTAFVKTAISNLINSAPTTLDTLNEIATALGNDPNFATTMATQLGLKANDADVVHKTGNETIAGTKTFSSTIAGSINGNAATATEATKLATARNLTTKLNSTTAVTFDGSANQNAIPVTGILPIANGGTGSDTQNFIGTSGTQTGITGNKTWKGHDMGPIVENTDGTCKLGFRTVSHGGGVYDLIRETWLLYREAATGYFSIQAKEPDATSPIRLRGYGDGRLTWDDSIVPQRHCRVGQSGTISDNKVWFKVAKLSVGDLAYSDYGIVFYVEDTQDSSSSRNIGILDVHWKNNGSKKKDTVRATWLYSHKVNFSDYVIAYDDTGSAPIVELWTRVNVGYQVRRFAVLNEFGFRSQIHTNEWDLINNYGEGETAIPSNFTQIQSTPASYWKDTAISNVTLGSATTATSSSKYTTSISGMYKELYVRLFHSTAQSTTATLRYRFVFSDGSSITGQTNNGISTSANNIVSIFVINNDGFLRQTVFRGNGEPASGAWYSLAGTENEYMPSFASPDAYITSFELWSTSTSVTKLPANFQIKIWGKYNI